MSKRPDVHPTQSDNLKRCNLMEHSPAWGGDGYCCAECGLVFVPETLVEKAEQEAKREELELLRRVVSNAYIEDRLKELEEEHQDNE